MNGRTAGRYKMNETIQAFLETIRKDGIERAEAEAEQILDEAKTEAERILDKARKDAERRIAEAEDRIARLEDSFSQSMKSAAATLVRSVRSEIVELCDRIVEEKAGEALSVDVMGKIIEKLADAWKPEREGDGIEVLLNENDLQKLEKAATSSLRERFLSGVVLKPVPDIKAGFRIGSQNGGMHYDFTAETIAEVISAYLSPRIAGFLEAGPQQDAGRSGNDGSER